MSHQAPGTKDGDSLTMFDSEEWTTFKNTHNKKYENDEEEKMRIKIFLETKEKIAKHNAEFDKGNVTYRMGLNQFADRTPEEMKRHC